MIEIHLIEQIHAVNYDKDGNLVITSNNCDHPFEFIPDARHFDEAKIGTPLKIFAVVENELTQPVIAYEFKDKGYAVFLNESRLNRIFHNMAKKAVSTLMIEAQLGGWKKLYSEHSTVA